MGNFLLAVRVINQKYIVVKRKKTNEKIKYGKKVTFGIILISGIFGLFILSVIIFYQMDKKVRNKRKKD